MTKAAVLSLLNRGSALSQGEGIVLVISCVNDVVLEAAVQLLAHGDEDIFPARLAGSAPIRNGFPRLIVFESDRPAYEEVRVTPGADSGVPTAVITAGTLARWRFERRASGERTPFPQDCADRIHEVTREIPRIEWIERLFRGLERASGISLPPAFKGFARRVLEYPAYYASLASLSERLHLTPGALQGRFFRRDLKSPSEHLRWLRLFAVVEVLSDPDVTVGHAAARFGYTSAGNLCRAVQNTVGRAPSDLRNTEACPELVTRFAKGYLGHTEREGWLGLEDLFCGIAPIEVWPASLTA